MSSLAIFFGFLTALVLTVGFVTIQEQLGKQKRPKSPHGSPFKKGG